MRVAIGSDHAGFELKEEIKKTLRELRIPFKDFGSDSKRMVDYPDFALAVAKAVSQGEYDRGILICGAGMGMAIAANKVSGIRATLCHDLYSAKLSREHNDANILTMGGRIIGSELACEIVKVWLTTPFSGEARHRRRIEKITRMETH